MSTETMYESNFGSSCPQGNALYPRALANLLWNKYYHTSGNHFSGYEMEITINTNAVLPWYFAYNSPCPSTKLDFRTVLMHEICHGLGFGSGVKLHTVTTSSGTNNLIMMDGEGVYPTIYDYYINDNNTGSSCTYTGNRTMVDLADVYPELAYGFCRGAADIHLHLVQRQLIVYILQIKLYIHLMLHLL